MANSRWRSHDVPVVTPETAIPLLPAASRLEGYLDALVSRFVKPALGTSQTAA
jgi:hypothetical protein